MAKKKSFVNPNNAAGREAYVKQISQIIKDRVCPFCPENFLKYHKKPILRRSANWLVTENMNPYHGAKHHLLFVHKKHIESAEQITPKAWQELLGHIAWAKKHLKIKGASFFMRFGDTRFTGGSVAHLHTQLISGGPEKKVRDPLTAVLGFKK